MQSLKTERNKIEKLQWKVTEIQIKKLSLVNKVQNF